MQSVWLAPRVAWRYLLSKKRHGAVGVITWISVAGVAVATAATICVLSVFNGFQHLMTERLELLSPDARIMPDSGRTFAASDSLVQSIAALPEVEGVGRMVEDRALAVYAGQEMPVRLRGVEPEFFRRHTAIDTLLVTGSATFEPVATQHTAAQNMEPQTDNDEFSEEAIMAEAMGETMTERVLASAGVAMRLGIPLANRQPLTLIAPRREGNVNLANPAASLQMGDFDVEGVYQAQQQDFDKDYVITTLPVAREILSVDEPAVTALEVYGKPGISAERLAAQLKGHLPAGLTVQHRLAQHEGEFRMANIEKWITFLLLVFIMLIASFNLISSLAMLVIDKQENLGVLHALGATRRRISRIFAWESGLVTLLGAVIGMALGVGLSLLQQHCGLIKLNGDPGTLIVSAYPAVVQWSDLLMVTIPLGVIGVITALLTARFASTRVV